MKITTANEQQPSQATTDQSTTQPQSPPQQAPFGYIGSELNFGSGFDLPSNGIQNRIDLGLGWRVGNVFGWEVKPNLGLVTNASGNQSAVLMGANLEDSLFAQFPEFKAGASYTHGLGLANNPDTDTLALDLSLHTLSTRDGLDDGLPFSGVGINASSGITHTAEGKWEPSFSVNLDLDSSLLMGPRNNHNSQALLEKRISRRSEDFDAKMAARKKSADIAQGQAHDLEQSLNEKYSAQLTQLHITHLNVKVTACPQIHGTRLSLVDATDPNSYYLYIEPQFDNYEDQLQLAKKRGGALRENVAFSSEEDLKTSLGLDDQKNG